MYTNNSNKDSLAIELNHTETDSIIEYDLFINKNVIKNFRFKKNQIEVFPRLHIKNEFDSFLFRIFDYIYNPSEKKVYILIDEWGKVKLYNFHLDPLKKEIGKIKEDGKLIFSYRIRQMDTDLFQANSICLKYIDNNIILMVSPPHPSPGLIFIKIPLNEFQIPVQLIPIKETKYISERLTAQDPVIYINPSRTDSIIPIIKDRVKESPYASDNLKYFFNLENTQRQDKDINGKNIYLLDRYFFINSDNKKLIIHYDNFEWYFEEYEEIPINPNDPINVSL